jgi:hypothetical protein
MVGELQPLDTRTPLVTQEGTPTDWFIRWAQQRQIDIGSGITAQQAQALIDDWAATRQIIAGRALDGGGFLSGDVTIDHAESLVAPGTYGTATKVPQFVVDQEGHVQGVVEVPISGVSGAAWTEAKFWNFAVDGAVSTVEANVTGAQEILIIARNVSSTSSVQRTVQVSIDGGVSWFTTSGDYNEVSTAGAETNNVGFFLHVTATTAARDGMAHIFNSNNRLPLVAHNITRGIQSQFVGSATAINRIRVYGSSAGGGVPTGNFNGGTIQVLIR